MASGFNSEAVAERLGLGAEHQAWLRFLETTGAPPDGLPLAGHAETEAMLWRVGVDQPDLGEILAVRPPPAAQLELWWLLERCYHAVLRDIGQQPGALHAWPALPAHLGAEGRCFWIWVYLAAIPDLRRWHRQRDISDEVSWATLADLGRDIRLHRLRNGSVGLDLQFWLGLHFRGELFELGRLQFNPYALATGPAGPLFWHDAATIERLGEGFRPGDPALGVHIPESGPLTPSACEASFQAAREFFAALCPEQHFRVATCTSWLMDDQLLEYLDPDANVVRFQQRFELVPGARDADESPVMFVFHRSLSQLDQVVPRTRLEKALVAHLAAGRHWRMRTGWLRL